MGLPNCAKRGNGKVRSRYFGTHQLYLVRCFSALYKDGRNCCLTDDQSFKYIRIVTQNTLLQLITIHKRRSNKHSPT